MQSSRFLVRKWPDVPHAHENGSSIIDQRTVNWIKVTEIEVPGRPKKINIRHSFEFYLHNREVQFIYDYDIRQRMEMARKSSEIIYNAPGNYGFVP